MSKSRGFTTFSLHKRGFTLVELLVTITIIAILSAVGLVTYSLVMKQGRDSKRQSDLRAIQSALEQYYHDQGFYPKLNSTAPPKGLNEALISSPPVAFTNRIGYPCTLSSNDCPPEKTYINSLPQDPTDPTGDVSYSYYSLPIDCNNSSSTNKCSSYCLYARLENSNPGIGSCPANGLRNFAVTPP